MLVIVSLCQKLNLHGPFCALNMRFCVEYIYVIIRNTIEKHAGCLSAGFPKMFTVPQLYHYTAAVPDDNMGVNLAQLTMSVFCYPMGTTIGCGLQNAHAFSPKKHTYVQKHRLRTSATCHTRLIPVHMHV